jgi:ubiquinone/menaquinone biosynthesis C-methylase UbiE
MFQNEDLTRKYTHFCEGILKPLFMAEGFDPPHLPYWIYQCNRCHAGQLCPLPSSETLADHYLEDYYGGKQTIQQHSSLASQPASKFKPWIEFFIRWINLKQRAFLTQKLQPGSRILDIGCGRGYWLKTIASHHYSCVGTDLFLSGTTPTNQNEKKLTFLKGDLLELHFPSAHFDSISIWHVLEHMDDPKQVIREISRILKPGGRLAIAVPNFESWQSRLFKQYWFHLDLPRHLHHFTQASLKQLLDSVGLQIHRIHTHSLDQNPFGWIQSFQNKFLPKKYRQGLYRLLKNQNTFSISFRERLFLYSLGALLLPIAIVETLLTFYSHQGATLVIEAVKEVIQPQQSSS